MAEDQVLDQDDINKLLSEDGGLDQEWDDPLDEASPAPPKEAEPPAHSFDQFPAKPSPERPDDRSLDFILDIPLEVSVELGRTKMVINDLLQLGQGSVIELTKLAGEPLEILINDKLVARGEVVVVNEKFGVRVTDIVSPMERVKSLA